MGISRCSVWGGCQRESALALSGRALGHGVPKRCPQEGTTSEILKGKRQTGPCLSPPSTAAPLPLGSHPPACGAGLPPVTTSQPSFNPVSSGWGFHGKETKPRHSACYRTLPIWNSRRPFYTRFWLLAASPTGAFFQPF